MERPRRSNSSRARWALIGSLLSAALFPSRAAAQDLSLRFPAALTRFSGYADVAAVGNASAASKWSTSINPASTGWLPQSLPFAFSPQFSAIDFHHGSDFLIYTESLSYQTKDWGTFQPALAQVRTNSSPTQLGPDLTFTANYYQIQWGLRPADDWAFGANFNYTDSHLAFSQSALELSGTEQNSYDLRVGILHSLFNLPSLDGNSRDTARRESSATALNPQHDSSPPPAHTEPSNFRAGIVLDYGLSDATTATFTGPAVPRSHARDIGQQLIARPGLAWEYAKDSTVYADYQLLYLTDGTGSLWLNRVATGIDHRVIDALFLRAGTLIDTDGHASFTTGLGIYPTQWFTIDVAYQHDMFPELHRELSHSQTFTVSLSLLF